MIGELEFIKQIQSKVKTIYTIDEIDVNPCVISTYQVNDYVLRWYQKQRLAEETRTNTDHGGAVHAKSHRCYNTATRTSRINHVIISGT